MCACEGPSPSRSFSELVSDPESGGRLHLGGSVDCDVVQPEFGPSERHQGVCLAEDELIAYCKQNLAAYKVPRLVKFVGDLPKTSTGKIMRRELHTLDR